MSDLPQNIDSAAEKDKSSKREYKTIDYHEKYPWLKEACPLSPDSALQNISSFLDGLVDENLRVLSTALYGVDTPLEKILADWAKTALPIREKMGPEYVEDFEDWMKKAGPRSPRHSWDAVKEIYTGYFDSVQCAASDEKISRAADFIMQYTGLASYVGRLRPMSIEEAVERIPKTTNWGMPFYLHGRVYKAESVIIDDAKTLTGKLTLVQDNVPMYVALAEAMARDPEHPGWSVPNLPFRRTDMKGPNPEDTAQRAVWGQPHAVSILDATIVGPITKLVQSIKAPGFNSIINEKILTDRIHAMLRKAKQAGRIVLGVDKDKWDHHVSRKWILTGFNRVGKLFQESALPSYYENLIQYFISSGMLTPDGLLSGRDDNVSSGSGFTLWLNTFIHLIVLAYVYYEIYGTFDGFEAECKGDDGLLLIEMDKVHHFVEITNEQTGMKNSEDKQFVNLSKTSFAKKIYDLDIPQGVPASSRSVTSMKHPDQGISPEMWTGYYESLRWLSIANNYWETPEFEPMVDWIIKGDIYGLGTLLEGGVDELVRRAGGHEIVNRTLGIESYAGAYKDVDWSNPSGMPIVNYLRTKAAERG